MEGTVFFFIKKCWAFLFTEDLSSHGLFLFFKKMHLSLSNRREFLADIFTNLSTNLVRNWFGYHHEEVKIVKVKVCQSMIWNDQNGIKQRQLLDNCLLIGHMGVSKNRCTPQIIHFNRVFHYKPSILGYPIFGNTHMFLVCWNFHALPGNSKNLTQLDPLVGGHQINQTRRPLFVIDSKSLDGETCS